MYKCIFIYVYKIKIISTQLTWIYIVSSEVFVLGFELHPVVLRDYYWQSLGDHIRWRDWTQVGYVQNKHATCCTVTLAPLFTQG